MQNIKCFEVYGHTDTTEGRGPMKVVARFTTRSEAEKYVTSDVYSQYCVMGYQSPRDVEHIRPTTILILDSMSEFEEIQIEKMKSKALTKLTDQEKKILGL